MDNFKYKVDLSPEQFISKGYAERKMCLIIDVYNLVKLIRQQSKVHKRIAQNVDEQWEHPCDEALKHYELRNHKDHTVKDMQFKINATLLKS